MILTKKKLTAIVTTSFIFASALVPFIPRVVHSANDKEVSVVLSKNNIKIGDEFNIEFKVKDIKDIYGASLDLNIDSSILEIKEVMTGSIYNGLTSGVNYKLFRQLEDKAKGKISSVALLNGTDNGLSNDGSIFIVKAKALKSGSVNLNSGITYDIKLSNSNKTFDNKIKDFNTKNLSFNITEDKKDTLVKEKLENADSRIKFSGTWYSHWEPRNSGGSALFTNDKPASFEFTFDGTGFKWYGLANKFKGKAKITIDGNTQYINTYSEEEIYRKLFYEKLDLNKGTHTVKIEVESDYLNIDYIEILDSSTESTPSTQTPSIPSEVTTEEKPTPVEVISAKKIEQNDSSIKYNGYWLNHWEPRNSGGSAKFTNEANAYFEFSFDGVGFKWYGLANKFKGKAKITIDGISEIVNTYSEKEEYKKLFFEKTGLANGKHTVRIETNTDYINIDYIEILQSSLSDNKDTNSNKATNTSSSPTLTGKWTTIDEKNSIIKFTGTWLTHNEARNNGGSAKYTNYKNATVEFSFIGTGFRWYGLANKYKGPALVTIDGKSERVETFSKDEIYKKLFFEKNGLEYGVHKVKFEVLNEYINIDFIEIENYKEAGQ